MDPTLHYRVYECGMDKEAIPGYIKYFKSYYLSYTIKDHVRRARSEIKSWRETIIIKVD